MSCLWHNWKKDEPLCPTCHPVLGVLDRFKIFRFIANTYFKFVFLAHSIKARMRLAQ